MSCSKRDGVTGAGRSLVVPTTTRGDTMGAAGADGVAGCKGGCCVALRW